MSTNKPPTVGIQLVDCEDAVVSGGKIVGFDHGIDAVRTTGLKVDSTLIISGAFTSALAANDKVALVLAIGLPMDTPPALVGEALRTFADHRSDLVKAESELRDSRLAQRVGVAADLAQLSQFFVQIVQSGYLMITLACLSS